VKLSLDFETRSTVDLKLAGAYVYAKHDSTVILCAAYSIDDGDVLAWQKWAGEEMPADLAAALDNPRCEIHAWNAQFERLILRRAGFDLPLERFHCTAAWARCSGLPGKLEVALEFIGEEVQLAHKREGYRVMMKWCRPLPDGGWAGDPAEYVKLVSYCQDDVVSEIQLQRYLADTPMSDDELADFYLCERINDRGLPIDVALAQAAQVYGKEEREELDALLSYTSGGMVTSASQHARVKAWLREAMGEEAFLRFFEQRYEKNGEAVVKVSTDKRARGEFLLASESAEYPDAVELVSHVDDASKSSVVKYATMAARASDGGRAQGSYLAFGAVQTKRYRSRGVQAHNFPREVPEDVPGAVQAVLERRVKGKVMHVLASLLRPAIKAPEGRRLVWGDWSAVEARGMPWLAGCEWKLDLYRKDIDVYRVNAEQIFGVPYAAVTDKQRQVGKVAELSLQFGGAVGALKAMARNYGIGFTDGEALDVVCRWREANTWAARFSYGLKEAYDGATDEGCPQSFSGITYTPVEDDYYCCTVVCTLPDGTQLFYPGNETLRLLGPADKDDKRWPMGWLPRLQERRRALVQTGPGHKDVRMVQLRASNMPEDGTKFLKAGAAHYRSERVWHGLLAENVTQAICAALLRDCLRRVETALVGAKLDAFLIGHTHDEILLEASARDAPRAEKLLAREMCSVPKWLAGFPLAAEVKTAQRYGK